MWATRPRRPNFGATERPRVDRSSRPRFGCASRMQCRRVSTDSDTVLVARVATRRKPAGQQGQAMASLHSARLESTVTTRQTPPGQAVRNLLASHSQNRRAPGSLDHLTYGHSRPSPGRHAGTRPDLQRPDKRHQPALPATVSPQTHIQKTHELAGQRHALLTNSRTRANSRQDRARQIAAIPVLRARIHCSKPHA